MKKMIFAVLAAALALVLAGCGDLANAGESANTEEDSYAFRFKVDNDTNQNGGAPKTIKKVEFINGDRQNDNVVGLWTVTVEPGDRSSLEYTRSGFTVKHDDSRRKCGAKVTFEDDSTAFGWDAFGHNNKVLVSVNYSFYVDYYYISFSVGNW